MDELRIFVSCGQYDSEYLDEYRALHLVITPEDTIVKEWMVGTRKEDASPHREQVLRMGEAWELLEQAQQRIMDRKEQILESLPLMTSDEVRQRWKQPMADLEAELVVCTQIAARFEAKRNFP